MGFFLLTGFHQYLVFRQEGSRFSFGLALVLFIAALLSKEMGILLPFFLVLYEVGARLIAPLQTSKRQFRFVIPFVIIAILYLVLRSTVLDFLHIPFWKGAQADPFSDNLWIRLLTAARVHWIYLRLLFWPVNLHMDHDVPIASSWCDPLGIAAMIGIAWLIALGWFLKGRNKIAAFGLFWYLGGLVPVSNFLPLNTAIAEHYLYIPSIGFFIAVVALMIPAFRRGNPPWLPFVGAGFKPAPTIFHLDRHRGLPLLGVLILLCLLSLTFLRTREWGDEEKLYLSTVNNTRASFRANNNLGVYYFRKGEIEKAEEYFNRSLDILPTYAEALNNVGAVYQKRGDLLSAVEYYQKSIVSSPNYLLAHENLLALYRYLKMEEEAAKETEAIRQIHQKLGFPLDKL
ncbi:MAG: tetratricopeptide repeat protein [Candidatus Omnitrophica bacterium]|nr:tetratricopeptide repeat protein [Candidatus Omnitrophota bacterium]